MRLSPAHELSREHARELMALETEELRTFRGVYEDARFALLGRLTEVQADTFTAQHVRSTLAQVSSALRKIVGRLGEGREKQLEVELSIATRQTLAEIAMHEAARGFGLAERIQLGALRRVNRSLLAEQFSNSISAWGRTTLGEVQRRLSVHLVMRSSWRDMALDIAGQAGAGRFGPRVVAGARWKAERIVRTELHHALAQGNQGALEETAEELTDLRRQWDSAMDTRTSPLCRALDGQVRGLYEPFEGDGRTVAGPPAHPNCRSRLVPWRAEWSDEITQRGVAANEKNR